MQEIVTCNPSVHYIEFTKENGYGIFLQPDTSLVKTVPYKRAYDIDYAGRSYLFARQFGEFPKERLLGILDSLSPKNTGFFSFNGKIYASHISVEIESEYYPKDEMVFQRVEYPLDYPGGESALSKYIQDKIPASIRIQETDSALFFRVVIKRDSLVHDVVSLDSINSKFSKAIQAALRKTRGWTPLYKGGLFLNRYAEIFVRVRKDGTIEAAYRK